MMLPKIGRIVHYKQYGLSEESCRPAIIVHCWGEDMNSAVQLQVFFDTNEDGVINDGRDAVVHSPVMWKTSVMQGTAYGEWHSYEDCPNHK